MTLSRRIAGAETSDRRPCTEHGRQEWLFAAAGERFTRNTKILRGLEKVTGDTSVLS